MGNSRPTTRDAEHGQVLGLWALQWGLVMAMLALLTIPVHTQELVIADNGHSDFVIAIADVASPSTKYAAEELQRFLEEISGAELPIITVNNAAGGADVREHEIILGDDQNPHLTALHVQVDFGQLGKEGYVLRTVGPHLIIAGSGVRGALYGVYGLLEDHLGCRWFTPTISRIPRRQRLTIGPLDETKVPVLEYREPFVRDCFDGDWCARNRVNSNAASLEARHGGKISYYGFVHTFNSYVPPEKYYDQHPEYFSLIDGKRMKGYYQLCLTNPDVLRITIEGVRQAMRDHPEATVFSVSQNDTGYPCQCADCQAIVQREGTEAGPIIEFVNKVADAVADEFPDKAIDTLAYSYSRKPPRTLVPRPNVIVRLCSIECCFSHPLATCDSPENTAFRQDIEGWAKVCRRLWVWDYTTSFANYLVPFPNLRVLNDNIQFFAKHNVTGIFEEDCYTTLNGELNSLAGYMQAKFLWNPDYDEDTALNEFLEGVYGKAAGPIRRYIDLLHDKVAKDNIHMHIWEGPGAAYLTDEILAQADALWDEAEAAVADQPEVLQRVRIARLSPDWVILERTTQPATKPYEVRNGRYETEADPAFRKRLERFLASAEAGQLAHLNEGGYPVAEFRKRMMAKAGSFEVVALSNEALKVELVPALGGRMITLQAQPDGPNLLFRGTLEDQGYPNVGGYAESWQGGFQGPGWANVFDATVEDMGGLRVAKLATSVADGVTMTREVAVPVTGASVRITSTLTNSSAKLQPGDLRAALALNLGSSDEVTAVLPAMGEQGVISLSLPEDQAARQLSFTGEQLAQGVTLANHSAGIGLRIRPPAAGAIERAWLRVDARRSVVTFEIKTQKRELRQGESVAVASELEPLRDVSALPQAQHTGARTHRAEVVVAQDDQLGLGRYGEWCWIEPDSTAEDGFSVHLANTHIEWCVQWPYSPALFEPGTRYDVYARIRVDKRGEAGNAFWAGIYDTVGRRDLGSVMKAVRDVQDSDWHMYKLGTVVPAQGHYVWVGPYGNAENVGGVWLDYFELRAVKE